jgi:release factor glutamine methyltransferase
VAQALAAGRQALAQLTQCAAFEAEALLAALMQIERAQVLSRGEAVLPAQTLARYQVALARRATGEPYAYIVGCREFWTLRLKVSPAVLIPRPETELVVERALALKGSVAGGLAALDLGTGSGAIALSLARERPAWLITATDLSHAALAVARDNARELELANLRWREGAWFTPLVGERFDLICSNPPYIAAGDPALEDPGLRHEPLEALTPGDDALASLSAIIDEAPRFLNQGGALVLEHGAEQAGAVAQRLVARGFDHVRSHRDLAGHERVTEGISQGDAHP